MSVPLSRYGSAVDSVFDLLGRNEVDLTAALGWALAKSPSLLRALLERLDVSVPEGDVVVALESADADGRTDIELVAPTLKVVIEAKQGWLVPDETQLQRYVGRFRGFTERLLVSTSDSSALWASDQLPAEVDGVPVRHVAWDEIRTAVRRCQATTAGSERLWLSELERYMGKATSTVPYDDQWTFCVVVSDALFGGISFRDYVQKERVYFHAFGGNNTWPKVAPNFLCFRSGGLVRQVNRVVRAEVVPTLAVRWPAVKGEESDGPHIIYDLGPDIPIPKITTQGTYATGRVWCLLDQLLVQPTLADAVVASKRLASGSW